MDNQWFYIKRWNAHSKERLAKHRIVRVSWDTDLEAQSQTLPQFVKIPDGIELTNTGITNYLSDQFGWCVLDWSVAYGSGNESRI